MASREQSIPAAVPAAPPVPLIRLRPEDVLFRYTFTYRFENEDEAAALLLLGQMLASYQNETGQWGNPSFGGSLVGKVWAVADDAEALAAFLTMMGRERHEINLELREQHLSTKAEKWGKALAKLAEEMREEVRQ